MKETQYHIDNLPLISIDKMPGFLAITDADFKILSSTSLWKAKLETTGDSLYELNVAKSGISEWQNLLKEALQGNEQFFYENNLEEDSIYRWSFNPYDLGNKKQGIIVQRDYLKKTRTERIQKLRKEANRVADIGYWEVDVANSTVFWSSVTKRIHEVSPDFKPTLEEGINFYKEGYSRDTITQVINESIKNGTNWDEELILITSTGKEVWVKARGESQFENGVCVRILGTFQDITSVKNREIALAKSEERFRMAFNNTLIAFMLIDAKTLKIKNVNKAAEGIFGLTREEFLDREIKDLAPPDDNRIGLGQFIKLFKKKEDQLNFEQRYFHKDGSLIVANVYASLIFNENGEPDTLVAQIRDITELKRKSEEVENFLDVTTRQNKRLVNFSHIVSHNLRSHTSNISMLLNFMKTETDAEEKEEQFNMLVNASDMLCETIDHLNSVISLDTDNLKKEKFNLFEFLENVIAANQGIILNSNFKVINEVKKDFTILAIPAYLDSILLNMLTNAIRYSSSKRDSWVKFSSKKVKGYRVIEVEDNGLGIDLDKHKNKIFGLYKTFHNHPDSKGLGLYMTKRQIEVMGGKIEVESQIDKGTIFKIYLNEKN